MRIVVKDETPIQQRPRTLSKYELELVDNQIAEWLAEGIVTESISEFRSPIVIVKKKDGTTRIFIDYRRLNKVVVRDHFPLPLVEDQIDRLADAKIFTTLDLKNGFFHMPIEKDSRKYSDIYM